MTRNLIRRALLLDTIHGTLLAIGPDGYPEEDIGYGSGCAGMLGEIAEPLHRAGVYNAYKNCPRYAKFGRSNNGEWVATHWPGRLTAYAPGDFVDFAAVDSSHQHNCYWANRSLGFVKGRGGAPYLWIVDDINKNNDRGEYWWQMQTRPENTIGIDGDQATVAGWRHGHMADVHIVLPVAGTYPKPRTVKFAKDVQTTCSTKYVGNAREKHKAYDRPADMLHGPCYWRPRLLAKIKGYCGRFMSLAIPRRPGQKPAKVDELKTLPMAHAVRVRFADVEDTIIFAYEHHMLEAAGIVGRGQWCVVRRNRKSGKMIACQLHGGHSLVVDNRERMRKEKRTKR